MSTRTGGLPRAGGRTAVLALLSACVLLGLALAGPALAADGVPVITTPLSSPYLGESQPSISGDFLAYAVSDTVPALSDDSVIALKYLRDGSAPWAIARPSGFKDMMPQILVQGSDITVVWTRLRLEDPWDGHLWIWKGTYDGVAAGFVPADDSYPKELVTGPLDASPLPTQWAPALGLATVGGEQHAIVAWEDTRDNGYSAPLIYSMDLTTETTWDPTSAGYPVDPTDVWARGQHSPAVGLGGIYWLDDRWSWWDSGNLTDTAVWRANLNTGDTGAFFTDSDHSYDNGADSLPRVTSNGALWLRSGPYGASVQMPFIKPAGSAGHTVGPIAQPLSPATYTRAGASSTGLAIAGKHGNSAGAADWDIFFFDTTAGVQVPVCNRSVAASDAEPDYFKGNQQSPAVGPGFFAYRVVWVDQRGSAAEDSPDARLYEAFVPTVRWTLRPSSILDRVTLRATVTVLPDFSGEPVYLQRLKRSVSKGAVVYKPYRGSLATAKMVPGSSANESSSVATLKWKPTVKGTYYLRMWFPGAAKYGYDGTTVATGKMVVVPHVGNASKVFKLVVK